MPGMLPKFGKGTMYWTQFYHLRYSLRSSLWTIPIIAIPFAMFATRLAHWLDARIHWSFLGFGVKGAEALLQATATATLSFLVFTFESLLVALQVASGQLTPRIIVTTLLRNNVVRYTVGLFIFTFLFTLGVQNRLELQVYQLPLIVAAVLALLCFAAFLYLIDYAARLLRPISILTQVGNVGLGVIEDVYPDLSLVPGMPPSQRQTRLAGSGYLPPRSFRDNSRSQPRDFEDRGGKSGRGDRTRSPSGRLRCRG
jgi:uncharacterized membrane protein